MLLYDMVPVLKRSPQGIARTAQMTGDKRFAMKEHTFLSSGCAGAILSS
jgi:hypothetical protein